MFLKDVHIIYRQGMKENMPFCWFFFQSSDANVCYYCIAFCGNWLSRINRIYTIIPNLGKIKYVIHICSLNSAAGIFTAAFVYGFELFLF